MQQRPTLQELCRAFASQRAEFWIARRRCEKREATNQKAPVTGKALLLLTETKNKLQAPLDCRINLLSRIGHELTHSESLRSLRTSASSAFIPDNSSQRTLSSAENAEEEIIDKRETNSYTLRISNWCAQRSKMRNQ